MEWAVEYCHETTQMKTKIVVDEYDGVSVEALVKLVLGLNEDRLVLTSPVYLYLPWEPEVELRGKVE